MSRLIKRDFALLKSYIESYCLSTINADGYVDDLKPLHKSCLTLIALVGEMLNAYNGGELNVSKHSIMHLSECMSDVGESIFCWIHGAYKPSMLIARSSIENFIKSVVCTNDPSILEMKRVNDVFGLAKTAHEFVHKTTKINYRRIHAEYKNLCKYVHTASEINMSKIGSLAHFPSYDKELSRSTSTQRYELIRNYVNILSALHYSIFTKFHHTNRSIIMDFVQADVKDIINGATSLTS